MTDRSSAAGGFPLIVAILAGFAFGSYFGAALFGTLAGTAVGTLIAIYIWRKDRLPRR